MNPPTLTILETHRLGDAVLTLPFIFGAMKAGWRVTAAAPPGTLDVFRLILPDHHLLELPKRGSTRALRLARQRWQSDTAVSAWADPRLHATMLRAGFPTRIGFPATPHNLYAREAALLPPHNRLVHTVETALTIALGPLLTLPLHRSSHHRPHADNWTQTARALGFTCLLPPDWLQPQPSPPQHTQTHWLVHPGAGSPWKLWPPNRWLDLLSRMSLAGLQPTVITGQGIPSLPGWTGPRLSCPHLRDLAQALHHAAGLVALDSFPAHLSAALARPTVVLFGAMKPDWFAPRGSHIRIAHTPASWPIRRRDLPALGGSLLHSLTVDHVWQELTHLNHPAL